MKATYIDNNAKLYQGKHKGVSLVLAMVAFMAIILPIFLGGQTTYAEEKKPSKGITYLVVCKILNIGDFYNGIMDLPFYMFSKSAYAAGIDEVDGGLNSVLNLGKPHTFKEINQRIVGYPLGVAVDQEQNDRQEDNYNKGEAVNPYDRFGIAGLNFSAYGGEFRHSFSDICGEGVKQTNSNAFYTGRLEPQGSFWEVSKGDPRSEMRQSGSVFNANKTAIVLMANFIFTITKIIVVLTISFIGFAFSDLISFLGLTKMLAGDSGIFMQLYNGIFTPLIVMVFTITGLYVLWNGLVKAQVRETFVAVLRSVALFVIAIFMAANPLAAITLPNNVATIGQAFILSSFSSSMTSGQGICATDVGAFTKSLGKPGAPTGTVKEAQKLLDEATETARSTISCQIWKAFLLNPWAEGQFGTGFNNLWANDKIAPWAGKGAQTLGNTNDAMVGDAEVPLGGGKVVNNWALFQVSTQTDVHAPIDPKGGKPVVANGFNNDWYRVVDAMSNYSEKQQEVKDGATMAVPEGKPYHKGFLQWAGNTPFSPLMTAFSSIFFAMIGLIAPLFFAALAGMYAIGLGILMAFAPVMLLLGCYPGKGYEVFKGWLEAVANTIMKRLACGVMLSVVLIMIGKLLEGIDNVGWWTTLASIIILTLVMIKARHKLLAAMASFHFANVPFAATANQIGQKFVSRAKKTVGTAKDMGVAGIVGGMTSRKYGGTFKGGMARSMKREVFNKFYQSRAGRMSARTYEKFKASESAFKPGSNREIEFNDMLNNNQFCSNCGMELLVDNKIFDGGMDSDGNLVCAICRDSGDIDEVQHIYYERQTDEEIEAERKKHDFGRKGIPTRGNSKELSEPIDKQLSSLTQDSTVQDLNRSMQVMAEKFGDLILEHKLETAKYQNAKTKAGIYVAPPEQATVPDELNPYINKANFALAWQKQDYAALTHVFSGAVEQYMWDNADADAVDIVSQNGDVQKQMATLIDEQVYGKDPGA